MPRTATPKTSAQIAVEKRDEAIKTARRELRAEKLTAKDKFNDAMAEAWIEYSKSSTNGSK
jgi:hypothetical protein